MSRGEQQHATEPATLHWAGAFWSGFHSAAVGMALVDTELELVAVNDALADLVGRGPRELVGAPCAVLAAAADAPALEGLLHAALAGRTLEGGLEIDMATERAPWCRAVVSASALPDDDGRVTGLLVHVQDVTSRRAAEDALRATEARFRLLVESIADHAMFMLDPDGMVTTWNTGAERLTGYEEHEVLGSPVRAFYTPEDQARGVPAELLAQARREGSVRAEGWRRRKDGSRFWAETTITALVDDEGELQGFAKVTHDVTERRQAEEELRQAQRVEALGRLAGGVAHDFNNLLAAMLGYGEVLRERLAHDPEARSEVQQIIGAANRARDLVAQLLAFSRRHETARTPLDLPAAVTDMRSILTRILGEGVRLQVEIEPGTARALADRGEVEQLLVNLVVNAQDAMPEGGDVVIEVRNAVAGDADDPDAWVALRVTDTGSGMDAGIRERAFDPFFTTKPLERGTGLGLSTVYGLVRQNDGRVRIDSSPGSGSTVTVLLPRARPVVEATPEPRPLSRERGTAGATVLLVDDEEPVRSMLQLVLRQRGYAVVEASDGMAGLEVARRHQGTIDLIITDVAMPRMNGPDLVAELRLEGVHAKVIYISGFTAQTLDIDQHERFLQKPFSLAELLDTAAELLDAS